MNLINFNLKFDVNQIISNLRSFFIEPSLAFSINNAICNKKSGKADEGRADLTVNFKIHNPNTQPMHLRGTYFKISEIHGEWTEPLKFDELNREKHYHFRPKEVKDIEQKSHPNVAQNRTITLNYKLLIGDMQKRTEKLVEPIKIDVKNQ
ncbi:MAG: hypothetical protein GF334_02305 [Candidatus Altiarchaeales archaeon]|nr:hypothetical protein [Candidatus Altiarchaeales archaeon]